jgi:dipeptidyl-peptidase-4
MEVAMRRLFVLGFALLTLAPDGIAKTADESLRRPTIEALFETKELDLEELDNLMWLPDGGHIIYWTSKGEANQLWQQSVTTGERRLIADWAAVLEQLSAQRPNWIQPSPGDVNSAASHATTPVLSPDGSMLAGGHAGDLYLFDLATGAARFVTGDPEEEIFPAFSPDGSKLGFAKDGDLYWLDLESGVVHRLTDRGDSRYLLNGVADWVYEEELDVERSYWWSPDGARIAFLQFDESPVGVVPITGDAMPYPDLEHQWYPKAGTANPVVRLGVVGLKGGEPRWIDTGNGDDYLARAGWTPAGGVWVERLNRDQNVLDLMLADPATGAARTLVTDTDPAWINVRDDLVFLDDGRFLWTSERTGWRHLYLYGQDGALERRLTSGEWQIDKVYGVDDAQTTAFFRANLGDPRQLHLYRVGLDGGEVALLGNQPRGVHAGSLSPDGALLVDQWSTLDTPPRADLLATDGAVLRRLWQSGDELAGWDLQPLEPGSVTADDGTELFSLLMRPRNFDPAKRYPVVLYVYGGPHSQLTADSWGGSIHHTYRLFAEMGIATFLVDNRGTWGRGHAFETAVHRRLGELEVADQLAAARWLKSQPWVDPDRIAVYGGSYGGYMTLLLMLEAPGVFRAGIAYAPVTDWRLYDTIYTERYMDTPQSNPEGYKQSAPLEYADNLAGALLLAHGAMDNNVHLQNTLQLIGRLAAADKSFEFMIYPRTRHGIRRSKYALPFHRLKINFLRRTLLGPPEE